MKIHVDYERAKEVFGALIKAMRKGEYPYDFAKLPQREENMPKNLPRGGAEEALFFFAVCYWMRGTVKSNVAFPIVSRLHEKYPEIFEAAWFLGGPVSGREAEIGKILQENGLSYQSRASSRFWVANTRKLHRFWRGDPRNLFTEASSYKELVSFFTKGKNKPDSPYGFGGFREKMVSMLAYFYEDAGIIDEPSYIIPVPVDFQILRICISTQIMIVEGLEFGRQMKTEEFQVLARELSERYTKETGISHMELANAVWLFGSNMCGWNPGNASKRGKYKARQTAISDTSVIWSRDQIQAYLRSCGKCVLSGACEFNIPHSYYYLRGTLVVSGRREDAPDFYRILSV